MENIKSIIESLLFVTDQPLGFEQIKKILPEADPKTIKKALDQLKEEYDNRQGGFNLLLVAGGYQFRTRPENKIWIARLLKPTPVRLSKAALETLAIIAYKQPVIRNDIENIRGVDSGGIIRMLLERKLIRVLGRKDIPGRPLIYSTTPKFLELFELKTLKDLPSLKEIEEFGKQEAELNSQDIPSATSDAHEKSLEEKNNT